MSVREKLDAIAEQRILILDGAMGSMIQNLKLSEADFRGERFADHAMPLSGCNDLLCLTRPQAISDIHAAYLASGADIIETCSFNATAVSLGDYGLADLAYEVSRAAANLARQAADSCSTADKPRFVAGSVGPTAKSASLSPDINDPAKRAIYWDELEAAYYDHARGLLDGGADIFLLETIFDTLNAKVALFAIGRLLRERNSDIPIMVSATVSGDSGRLLCGQTLAAFCASVQHCTASKEDTPWAIGLNCSFGAEKLLPHIRTLSAIMPCKISAHPNAGLPNQQGGYDESPEMMAACIERYLQDGLLNIVGGCCGSTPAHIAAIAAKAALYQPRPQPRIAPASHWAGLELLSAGKELTLIGDRTNVAGCKEFSRLISENEYEDAADIARDLIDDGAAIIDIGMDDAMLDSEKAMGQFLNTILFDPNIAKVPFMIDSSRWSVLETGLKHLQGKCLVNSLSLKDGQEEFLRRAALVRRYGAAAVVMLIDEQGQAVSFERKIAIAGRAYRLLTEHHFPPEDIVLDPNVFIVATGMSEYDSCAVDFIRACAWIRDNCPGVQISGGVSNLSFRFRGNNAVREALHGVFLKHAAEAGLSMAMVNPATLVAYDDIAENLRNAAEDVILNRSPDAAERLIAIAEQTAATPQLPTNAPPAANSRPPVKNTSLAKIVLATVKGDVHDIGKNMTGMVLARNGYTVIDLGVMVPAEQIVAAAEKEQAAIIGLSALISPSLDEVANVAREMEKRRMKIPLLVGGAAASLAHTNLRLAPEYSGPVIYVPDAEKVVEIVDSLLSEKQGL